MEVANVVGVQPLRKPSQDASLLGGQDGLDLHAGLLVKGKSPQVELGLPHLLLLLRCWFQTRSGVGWKRVLRSLCHSRTRAPLLAAIYFLMVHVILILCLTGYL